MDSKQIYRILSGGYLAFPIFILLAFGARLLAGVTFHEYIPWIVLVIQIGIASLLLQINHEYRLIEKKTFLPATLFLLFTAYNPALYNNLPGNISALAIVLCLIPFLRNYHNPQSQAGYFNIALILTVGSVFCWQPLLLFIPLFWIGSYWFRAFNPRTFFASLLGIVVVYLFLFSWCLYSNDIEYFYEKLPQIENIFFIHLIDLHWYDWITEAFIFLLLIISAVNIFMSGFSEKVKTTLFFRFLYLMIIVYLVLACVFNLIVEEIQPIISALASFLIGYYFSISDNEKWTNYLFFFTLLFFTSYYILQVCFFVA